MTERDNTFPQIPTQMDTQIIEHFQKSRTQLSARDKSAGKYTHTRETQSLMPKFASDHMHEFISEIFNRKSCLSHLAFRR